MGSLSLVRAVAAIALSFTCALPVAASAGSQRAGSLDRSFGDDGRVLVPIKGGRPKVASAPDGSLFVANDRQVVHILPSGKLDPTFGTGGLGAIELPDGLSFSLSDLAVDRKGRPLVFGAGSVVKPPPLGNLYPPPNPEFAAVIRFQAGGLVDTSFSNGGAFLAEFGVSAYADSGPAAAHIAAATLDRQGRPVFVVIGNEVGQRCGQGRNSSLQRARRLVRLNHDGFLDSGFGHGDGVEPIEVNMTAAGIALDRRNAITLVGSSLGNCDYPSTALAAFHANGTAKTGLGSGARYYRRGWTVQKMSVNRDGEIALLLVRYRPELRAVLRLDANGDPVRSFGKGGIRGIATSRVTEATSLLIDDQNRILILGTGAVEPTGTLPARRVRLAVERLLPSGSVDRGFGQRGAIRTSFGPSISWSAEGVFWHRKLLVAGAEYRPPVGGPPSGDAVRLARYDLGR